MLQNRISLQFNNKMPSNRIEIYKNERKEKRIYSGNINIGNHRVKTTENEDISLKWSIVPYDTVKKMDLNLHKNINNDTQKSKSTKNNNNNN